MKISYIINARFPTERAHGAQVMKMCEAFVQAGAEVELIIPRRVNKLSEPFYEYYGVTPSEKLRVTRLPVIDLMPWGVPFAFSIEALTFALSCSWYIRRTKPQLVYTRGESVLLLARVLSKNMRLFWETHIKPENMQRYKRIFSKISGFITVTKLYANELITQYCVGAEKVLTAPDGIDESFFEEYSKSEVRKELGLPEDTKIVMYMGLFETWKGVSTLLDASYRLRQQGIRVAIAGGTNAEILGLKKEYPDVIFLGFTEYRRQPKLQQAADILIVPNSAKYSMSTHYTSPLKVFAHMASGVPLLASDLPSIREVLDERNANFFTPDSSDSLVEKITHIFKNYEEAKKKAMHAQTDAKQYLWLARAQSIIAFMTTSLPL